MKTRRIRPRNPIDSVVGVPGSKSIANRALILGALADGETVIKNVPDGDDTQAMIDALIALGIEINRAKSDVTILGPINLDDSSPVVLDARLAGTTSRFLTAVGALRSGPTTIDGGASLRSRPNADLRKCLSAVGAKVVSTVSDGLPVQVSRGDQLADRVSVRGDISSQFLTALLLIASSLPKGLVIDVEGDLVSRSYIEMTVEILRSFGVNVEFSGHSAIVRAGRPQARTYSVEPDASSASYPLAAAAIAGGRVKVEGLGTNSLQSDAVFRDLLRAMGCEVHVDDSTVVSRDLSVPLVGIDVDLGNASDLVPTLAAVCCFASTPSEISGIGFIRRKESNRIEGLAEQLCALGADVRATADGLLIQPASLHGGVVNTMHDHRIAMALALVGLNVDGVEITEPEVVSKSWPAYWEMFDAL